MQIGNREQPFIGPIERACRIGDKRRAGDNDFMPGASARRRRISKWIHAGL
jgi:hypothetical protein